MVTYSTILEHKRDHFSKLLAEKLMMKGINAIVDRKISNSKLKALSVDIFGSKRNC